MDILNKLTLRHLRLNKKRTTVTIIGIILSAALMVGIGTIASTMREFQLEDIKKSSGLQHATLNEVPYKNIKYIANNMTVEDYYLHYSLGYAVLNGGTNEFKPYLHLETANQSYLNTATVLEGRLPKNDKEIIISKHIKDNGGVSYKVGDTLKLTLGVRTLPPDNIELKQSHPFDTKEVFVPKNNSEYVIVGIMDRRYDEPHQAPGYTILTKEVKPLISENSLIPVSIIYKQVKDIAKKSEDIASRVGSPTYEVKNFKTEQTELKPLIDYNESLLSFYGASTYENINTTMILVITLVLTLIAVGCALVIYNSFAISVMERKKQFGLFSSIGATKLQLRKTVFFEALVVGAIGIPLGVLSGIFGIWVVIQIVNALLPSVFVVPLKLSLYPAFIIIPIIYMIITIIISAFLPAFKASRISPIEAIRLSDDIKMNKRRIKTSRLTNKLFGIEGNLALKNMKRNKNKYRITIISLVVSIVLFIGFSTFVEYGNRATSTFMNIADYDLILYQNSSQLDEINKTKEFVKNLPELDSYVMLNYLNLAGNQSVLLPLDISKDYSKAYLKMLETYNISHRDMAYKDMAEFPGIPINIEVLDNKSYQLYLKSLNLNEKDYSGSQVKLILANQLTFKEPATGKSMTIDVYNPKSIPNFKFNLETSNLGKSEIVTKNYPVTTVNKEPDLVNSDGAVFYISEAMQATLEKDFIPSSDKNKLGYNIDIRIKDKQFKSVYQKLKALNTPNLSIINYAEERETERNLIFIIGLLLYGFISLVTLIGVTSVFNTITTSIALRRKEFAVLRSIGLSPKGFRKIICFESFLYGYKALIVGLPLSFIVILLFNYSFSSMNNAGLIMPWTAIIICILAVFIITFLTMIYASRKIAKENILDAIREENI
ncbi:MAG: FtsX-like permease family protein [Bacilli bacterium]